MSNKLLLKFSVEKREMTLPYKTPEGKFCPGKLKKLPWVTTIGCYFPGEQWKIHSEGILEEVEVKLKIFAIKRQIKFWSTIRRGNISFAVKTREDADFIALAFAGETNV